ncbi:MAG TPA: phosphatidate cytidylyltransferase [Flavisolibacter sp.]|nr:phosphatidate cytidylyltransferase [Flavisolibacter sp.]
MKKSSSLWLSAFVLITMLSSCELIGGVFKAGFVTAIVIVVIVVILILWLVNRGRR